MVEGVKRKVGPIATEPAVEKLILLLKKYHATASQVVTKLDSSIDTHKRVKYWIATFAAAGLQEIKKTIENDPQMKVLLAHYSLLRKVF